MLRIAICDDNPLHLDHTASVVGRELCSYLPDIDLFPDAASLLRRLDEAAYAPDIAILDIEMDGKNGIELARELNRLRPNCRVIFLTGYIDYAPQVYEAEHVWLVLKSRMDEHMGAALRKALAAVAPDSASMHGITLKGKGASRFLPLGDILYLSRVGRKAQIVTNSGSYYSSTRPSELIPDELSAFFVRCHQGYWVNLNRITAMDKDVFVLSDGSRIPISRTCRAEARARFFERYHL